MIVVALWQCGLRAYAAIAVMASLVTLAYFLVLQRKAFFGKTEESMARVREARHGIVLASIALALVIVASGVCFPYVFDKFIAPMRDMLVWK
jgi:multicomponent Na+:H+ antiporter subunit D